MLFLNGMTLMGFVDARSVIPLIILVGLLQVVTPTFLIFTAAGDESIILNASGLCLFGFTYLYLAFDQWMGLDGTGLGYFSLFVAIWLHWALLWTGWWDGINTVMAVLLAAVGVVGLGLLYPRMTRSARGEVVAAV